MGCVMVSKTNGEIVTLCQAGVNNKKKKNDFNNDFNEEELKIIGIS